MGIADYIVCADLDKFDSTRKILRKQNSFIHQGIYTAAPWIGNLLVGPFIDFY